MSVTTQAKELANSDLLERLTRAGFAGYGLTHLLLAWVAVQIAGQRPAEDGDQSGALRLLASDSLGGYLVLVISLGFAAMTVWQVLSAAVGHREYRGGKRLFERTASAARAVLYAYLGWTALKVFKGAISGGDQQQKSVTDLLSRPNGQAIVFLAGLVLMLFGVGLVIYGWQERFAEHLLTERMRPETRRVARWLGIAGYVTKGVAYGAAGVLLTLAALSYDPAKARGPDAALQALAAQPYGGLLLLIVAAGLAAFAAFCFVQVKYRKV